MIRGSSLWVSAVVIALLATRAVAVPTKALLIGNSVYEPKCSPNFLTVPASVAAMDAGLSTAGMTIVTVADRNGIEMLTDVESNVPPEPEEYVVYYVGLGEPLVDGAPVGPDCTRMEADDLLIALDQTIDSTLLILDSCGSGAFADAMNALDPRICTITASTGSDCPTEGVFSLCFANGLQGAADANFNGMVTVAEAAAYAIANCGDGLTTPTWDGGCPDIVIGMGPVAVAVPTWGSVKARYR